MGRIVIGGERFSSTEWPGPARQGGLQARRLVRRSHWRRPRRVAKLETEEALGAEALLLGRRSYEFFAARWPSRSGEWADRLNRMPKYVVSSSLRTGGPEQHHDPERRRGKRDRKAKSMSDPARLSSTPVSSSCTLLIEHDLVAEVRLLIFPIVLGTGKRLFDQTSDKQPMRLLQTRTVGDGLVHVTYEVTPHA